MKSGTLYGIHAESSNQAVPLMHKYQAAGVQIAALLAHENPGLCVDAKVINPNILTIARWHNPNSEYEGGGGSEPWPLAKQIDFAAHAIQLIFDRTNDTEYQNSDYFCPGLNEWDKPGVTGWRNMAETWVLLCKEAARRSPEMEAKGLHPIRLAIPGTNNGTPEWDEMQAVAATGLFDLMKQRGDIFILHEGVWWDEPIDQGHGDLIPGAPSVPAGAGSKVGRVNYWYGLLGVQVPFVITEFYDGNKRSTDPAVRLAAMQWADRLYRHNPWCRGFCPFELTDIVDGPWWLVDFTPTFQSPAMLADMLAEKDKPNPTPTPGPIPPETDMDAQNKLAIAGHANDILALCWLDGKVTPFTILPPNKVIPFYHINGTLFAPQPLLDAAGNPRPVTWQMVATEVRGTLLRVVDKDGKRVNRLPEPVDDTVPVTVSSEAAPGLPSKDELQAKVRRKR